MDKNCHSNLRAIGYKALVEQFNLQVIPHDCWSGIDRSAKRKYTIETAAEKIHVYPQKHLKFNLESPLDHLRFAIHHEGINLGIICRLFQKLSKTQVEEYIGKHLHSSDVRKIWYLYEWILGQPCNLPSLSKGRYSNLLDPSKYYVSKSIKSPRHRILNNLLGFAGFCPMVKKSRRMQGFEAKGLEAIGDSLLKSYSRTYFFKPEFKAGVFKTSEEHKLAKRRYNRFVRAMRHAGQLPVVSCEQMINLHNELVLPEYHEYGFRKHQNYLAHEDMPYRGGICRISPKPEDVALLMESLLKTLDQMMKSQLHPVVIASVLSFGFSIIHPFADGNGRVQLALIYNVLYKSCFRSVARIFCRSITSFFYSPGFNPSVGSFDHALLALLHYRLHRDETLSVYGDTKALYCYIDFTPMAEFLFSYLDEALTQFKNATR